MAVSGVPSVFFGWRLAGTGGMIMNDPEFVNKNSDPSKPPSLQSTSNLEGCSHVFVGFVDHD